MNQHTCPETGALFSVTEDDKKFYSDISPVFNGKKYEIPSPTLSPDARWQRRLTWRNDRSMYRRKCSATGQSIVSIFSEDKPFPVYENEYWWSDKWSAFDYGRDIDFTRPFFEQFNELQNTVPHPAMAFLKPSLENSDYCNQVGYLKNCYLIFDSRRDEQCLYGKTFERCFDCMDCYKVFDCETCYECNSCYFCQFCTYVFNSHNSASCDYCSDLSGCSDCFGCVNLRNKKYCYFNEQLTEEEWKNKVADAKKQYSSPQLLKKLANLRTELPVRHMQGKNIENCTGDYLFECANTFHSFDSEYMEDSKYCNDMKKWDAPNFRCYDFTYFGGGCEECYECVNSGYTLMRGFVCDNIWTSSDVYYSRYCNNTKNLFGCFGMNSGEYCILNKQYKPAEYERLVGELIEHMQETGEWGEFFPAHVSQYSYNESVAMEFFPMTKQEVTAHGWKWKEIVDDVQYGKVIESDQLPVSISDVPDDILKWGIKCSKTGRLFKIVKSELEFYRKMNLPLPHVHPDARHTVRLAQKNPRHLWERQCYKCSKEIKTSYNPNRPEKVYCEECYLSSI